MQNPKKGMKKELFYNTPDGAMTYEEYEKYKSVGDLPTKKAGMLKTYADQPRELIKRKDEPAKKKAGLKGLISNAMNKAKSYEKDKMRGKSIVTKTKTTKKYK